MRTLLALSLAVLAATPALAGRPLTVDDASVNDAGAGHVEAWYARQPGRLHTWTVAPAYAPVNGLELGAAFTRDRTTPQSSAAVQAKWRITPVQDDGCNAGAVLGVAHEREFGAITAHVEAFGQRLAKPTFQIGARKDIAKGLQLDGTLGRSNRETLVSVGLKVGF